MRAKLKEKRAKLKEKRAKLKAQGVLSIYSEDLRPKYNRMVLRIRDLLDDQDVDKNCNTVKETRDLFDNLAKRTDRFEVLYNFNPMINGLHDQRFDGHTFQHTFNRLCDKVRASFELSELQERLRDINSFVRSLLFTMDQVF